MNRWPMWKIIAAYVLMLAVAVASIWFIDQKVHHLPLDSDDASGATTSTT